MLQLIRNKDEQALSVLYDRYYLPLCKKAFQRVPSTPRVEEMVQDVFVNLWMKAPELDGNGNVSAYLYATLRNKILHELRTEANRVFYLNKLKQIKRVKEGDKCLQDMYARETEMQISRIVQTLPEQCREAFRLSRFEHLSYKEIAERMQISVSTVEKHVSKALQILRLRLNTAKDTILILFFIVLFYS